MRCPRLLILPALALSFLLCHAFTLPLESRKVSGRAHVISLEASECAANATEASYGYATVPSAPPLLRLCSVPSDNASAVHAGIINGVKPFSHAWESFRSQYMKHHMKTKKKKRVKYIWQRSDEQSQLDCSRALIVMYATCAVVGATRAIMALKSVRVSMHS